MTSIRAITPAICPTIQRRPPSSNESCVSGDGISALVLCHAHDVESGILDTTAESFDRHVAVNARATFLLSVVYCSDEMPTL